MVYWLHIFFGVGLAVITVTLFRNHDRPQERALFAILLPLLAFFYFAFSAIGDESKMMQELGLMGIFSIIGFLGYKTNMWFLVLGYFTHGIIDVAQFMTHYNSGVPDWWPPLCIAFDMVIALYLFYWVRAEAGKLPARAR